MIENIDLALIITTAFLGSIGHCMGMCGGIVLAYTSSKISPKTSTLTQSLSHIFYNIGRVSSYMILGGIFGFIGEVLTFSPLTKGLLFSLTGLLMILTALSLLGLFKIEKFNLSKFSWYQTLFQTLLLSKSFQSFYFLGLLNGFLPCGLVYTFGIIASSTGSFLGGIIVMGIFGLSTIPVMFSLGFVSKFLQQGSIRKTMIALASLLVLIYGVMTLYKGYNFISNPQEMKNQMDKMHKDKKMKCAVGKCG